MKNNVIKKIDDAIISQIIEGNSNVYDEILKEQGFNIIDIENYANKNFRRHSFLLKGIINKQKDSLLLEKASTFDTIVEENEILNIIQETFLSKQTINQISYTQSMFFYLLSVEFLLLVINT